VASSPPHSVPGTWTLSGTELFSSYQYFCETELRQAKLLTSASFIGSCTSCWTPWVGDYGREPKFRLWLILRCCINCWETKKPRLELWRGKKCYRPDIMVYFKQLERILTTGICKSTTDRRLACPGADSDRNVLNVNRTFCRCTKSTFKWEDKQGSDSRG